jgi:predicted nuclease with TOPRIM domain
MNKESSDSWDLLMFWTVDELMSEVKSLKKENGHLQDEVSELQDEVSGLRVERISRDALVDQLLELIEELDPANRSVGHQASDLKT